MTPLKAINNLANQLKRKSPNNEIEELFGNLYNMATGNDYKNKNTGNPGKNQ